MWYRFPNQVAGEAVAHPEIAFPVPVVGPGLLGGRLLYSLVDEVVIGPVA